MWFVRKRCRGKKTYWSFFISIFHFPFASLGFRLEVLINLGNPIHF